MRKLSIIIFSLIVCLFMASQVLAQTYYPFPDTGQTMCYDAFNNEVSCDTIQPGDPYYGQDAHYQPRIPRSYTKLGHGGVELPDSAVHVDDGGDWIMTRDNVTRLIWEVKTQVSKNEKYSWDEALEYARTLNLGGFSDWRLPDVRELHTLLNSGASQPTIDKGWFPNTEASWYWSSTTTSNSDRSAWRVSFGTGYDSFQFKVFSGHAVAVRDGNTELQTRFADNGDGTVTDTKNGLMWMRCNLGESWIGSGCSGSPEIYNWEDALLNSQGISYAGHTDWRLPNRNELKTLVDYSKADLATDTSIFPTTLKANSWYWTSTTNPNGADRAWLVYFIHGNDENGYKSNYAYARAVRTVPQEDTTDRYKANIIFHWLESLFPQILFPSPQITHDLFEVILRYYPGSNVYIATYQGTLCFIDHNGALHDLGSVDYWLPFARDGWQEESELIGFGPIRIGETWVEHAHWDPYYVGMCHTFVTKTEAQIQYKYMSSPVTINYDTGSKPQGYQDIHPAVQGLPQLWFRTAGNRANEGDQMAVFKEQVNDNHIEVHRVWYYSDGTIDDEDEPSGKYRRYWLRMDCPH